MREISEKMWIQETEVKPGDVIKSPFFAKGGYRTKIEDDVPVVDKLHIDIRDPNYPRAGYTIYHHNNAEYPLNLNADDPDRAHERFVVESAQMTGGGHAMNNDHYPDAPHYIARSIEHGYRVYFTMRTNSYNNVIPFVYREENDWQKRCEALERTLEYIDHSVGEFLGKRQDASTLDCQGFIAHLGDTARREMLNAREANDDV